VARAANVVGTLPGGVLPGAAALFAPSADPRYNPFDWETWHEIEVLRRELAPRFEAKNLEPPSQLTQKSVPVEYQKGVSPYLTVAQRESVITVGLPRKTGGSRTAGL